MKSLKIFALSLVLLMGTTAFAQQVVTGIVEDADGALIGASVLVKGTTVGTITDFDGNFTIEANIGDELEFSYMGYSSQTVKVTGEPIHVILAENTEVLSEVVVTAMGIKRDRKALGYEVGEVKGEDLTKAKEAAIRAYAWAEQHPEVYYDQPKMNEVYKPEITTGAYDDFEVRDEFFWAATELYMLTGEETYKADAMANQTAAYMPAVWGNVQELGFLEWMMHSDKDAELAEFYKAGLLLTLMPDLEEAATVSVFRSPYGNSEEDFFWGCNSEGCCWRGIECLYAFHFSGDDRYFAAAQACLNYILGQNATGYCYVTGFGTKPSSHPHHRLSYSHPKGTHPGFLVGGPNRMRQDAETDGVKYPKNVPADESYLDEQPSYASNEVTINWNVTLFALSAGIDALE